VLPNSEGVSYYPDDYELQQSARRGGVAARRYDFNETMRSQRIKFSNSQHRQYIKSNFTEYEKLPAPVLDLPMVRESTEATERASQVLLHNEHGNPLASHTLTDGTAAGRYGPSDSPKGSAPDDPGYQTQKFPRFRGHFKFQPNKTSFPFR